MGGRGVPGPLGPGVQAPCELVVHRALPGPLSQGCEHVQPRPPLGCPGFGGAALHFVPVVRKSDAICGVGNKGAPLACSVADQREQSPEGGRAQPG